MNILKRIMYTIANERPPFAVIPDTTGMLIEPIIKKNIVHKQTLVEKYSAYDCEEKHKSLQDILDFAFTLFNIDPSQFKPITVEIPGEYNLNKVVYKTVKRVKTCVGYELRKTTGFEICGDTFCIRLLNKYDYKDYKVQLINKLGILSTVLKIVEAICLVLKNQHIH
jgi:hypothetical protein